MPVPRRFDRRPPEQDLTRINERIGAPEVRLIDDQGQQVGVVKTAEALRYARERDLDLVEVAALARPPVCRVLDYSKYKYEQAQKQKQARKHQQQITIREIKFRPKIAQHDYDTKKGHVIRFLLSKYKVKVTIMFRGREVSHPERGVSILDRLAEELVEVGVVEQSPTLEGRNMAMLLAPSKGVMNGQVTTAPARAASDGAAVPDRDAHAQEPAGAGATPASEESAAPVVEPAQEARPASAPEEPVAADQPEPEQPEPEKPEAEKPEAEKPEAEKPGAEQPGAEQPEAEGPAAEKAEAEEQAQVEPAAEQAGAAKAEQPKAAPPRRTAPKSGSGRSTGGRVAAKAKPAARAKASPPEGR
ncbi:MAG: translation initiation factor IF-3 [Acidobacteriota bacterium]|nr:translation initiation factor IF-3 [Acidobacteriota bacterium]